MNRSGEEVEKRMILCDFCGRTNHVVELIIQGNNETHICNECVDECVLIIKEEREAKDSNSGQ